MTSADMNASLRQVTQLSDAWLATIAHIARGWGGLIVSVCHVLVTILVLVTLKCRRSRERRRVRWDYVHHQAYRGRRRLIPLSDGSVTDVTDLSQELNDSVFVVWKVVALELLSLIHYHHILLSLIQITRVYVSILYNIFLFFFKLKLFPCKYKKNMHACTFINVQYEYIYPNISNISKYWSFLMLIFQKI